MHTTQWLRKAHPGLLAFHVPNERRGGIGAIMHFKRMGVLGGVADWLIFPSSGRRVAIELKDEDDKEGQRENQQAFERRWSAVGGEYFLVKSLAEFQAIVNALELF